MSGSTMRRAALPGASDVPILSDTKRRINRNNQVSQHAALHMNTSEHPLSDLPKLLKLSRGMLGTMRLLTSRGLSEYTSTGELLAMQRFFREFDDWIRQLARSEQEQSGLRATLRRRHLQHRNNTKRSH